MSSEINDGPLHLFRLSIIAIIERAIIRSDESYGNATLIYSLKNIAHHLNNPRSRSEYIDELVKMRVFANQRLIHSEIIDDEIFVDILLALDIYISAIIEQDYTLRHRMELKNSKGKYYRSIEESYNSVKSFNHLIERSDIGYVAREFITTTQKNLYQYELISREYLTETVSRAQLIEIEKSLQVAKEAIAELKAESEKKGSAFGISSGLYLSVLPMSYLVRGITETITSYVDKVRDIDVTAPIKEIKNFFKLASQLNTNFTSITSTAEKLQSEICQHDKQLKLYSEWAAAKLKQSTDTGVAQ